MSAKFLCMSLSLALTFPAWGKVNVESENNKHLTMSVTNSYVLGGNDTLTQGHGLLLEQLKKEASDYAGQYVESELKVSGNNIVKQQIRILTAGYMEVLAVENTRKINKAGSVEVLGKAKIRVSKESIRDGLKKLKSDPERKAQISKLEAENDRLRVELIKLSASINNESRIDLMNERKSVLSKLDNNREATKSVFEKGSLLQLANIGAKEYQLALDDINQNVFDYFKHKTKVVLGQPEFTINKDGTYDIAVPVEWNLKKQSAQDVLSKYLDVEDNGYKYYVPYSLTIVQFQNESGLGPKPYSADLQESMRKQMIAIEVSIGEKKGYLPLSSLTGFFGWEEYSLQFSNDSKKNALLSYRYRNPIIIKNVSEETLNKATSINSSVVVMPITDLNSWKYE